MGLANFRGDAGDNTPVPPFHPPTLPMPRRAFYQPCPDAMPIEVTVLSNTAERLAVVESLRGLPFAVFTRFGVWHTNVSPVPAAHVRLLAVRS